MTTSPLRIALLVDPLSMLLKEPSGLRGKWGDHAPALARELLGRGHIVRGFGMLPGVIPRSSNDTAADMSRAGPLRRRFFQGLSEFRPNVVVAYDLLSSAAFRGARMARKHGATLILVEAAVPGEHFLGSRLRALGGWLWGRYVRGATSAVVVLDAMARAQAEERGFESSILHDIPHGVDLRRFRPGLSSPVVGRHRIRGRIILCMGRLNEAGGIACLLDAFARTVGQRSDWNLVITGEGPRRQELQARASSLGIADSVRFLPPVREEELPGLMGASTLFVVPVRDADVAGRQMARALACGLPVIASNLPRLASLIEPEETGVLVEPGNVGDWEEALSRVASSPVARERWSRSARAFAERDLCWTTIGERFEQVFHEVRGEEHQDQGVARGELALRRPKRSLCGGDPGDGHPEG